MDQIFVPFSEYLNFRKEGIISNESLAIRGSWTAIFLPCTLNFLILKDLQKMLKTLNCTNHFDQKFSIDLKFIW